FAGSFSGPLQFGEPAGAEFFGEFLARRDIGVEPGYRQFGLLMEIVEQGKVASQRLLVAVELDGDAVDLRGHVVELFGEAAQARRGRGEQTADKIPIPEARRIKAARLAENVRE